MPPVDARRERETGRMSLSRSLQFSSDVWARMQENKQTMLERNVWDDYLEVASTQRRSVGDWTVSLRKLASAMSPRTPNSRTQWSPSNSSARQPATWADAADPAPSYRLHSSQRERARAKEADFALTRTDSLPPPPVSLPAPAAGHMTIYGSASARGLPSKTPRGSTAL
eukprot:1977884-Prymnesium_polylepis.1